MTKATLRLLLFVAPLTVAACSTPVDGEEAGSTDNALSGTSAAGTTLTTTARLNLRAGPSKDDEILTTIPKGVQVTAVGSGPENGYYEVTYNDQQGWAYSAYLRSSSSSASASANSSGASNSSGSGFNGRKYSNVTMLWQGNWSYLVKCDSYSRAKGRVIFYCNEQPSRSFVDDDAWIAVPSSVMSKSMCGDKARVCKGSACVTAQIVEKSETSSKWEGSTAVLEALGEDSGYSSCSNSYGTANNVTVTLQ